MDKNELVDLLLDRLPDGTVLDDDFLDKIAGGRDLETLFKSFALADKDSIPQRFASLADLANWAESGLAFSFRKKETFAKIQPGDEKTKL